MRVSLGIAYHYQSDEYRTYYEDDMERLIEELAAADLVIGYNSIRFDYSVLRAYTSKDPRGWKTLDLLDEIFSQHGYRVKLDTIGRATFNAPKSADGLMALEWWKEGKLEEIEKYCQMDVKITKRAFEHALEHGFLMIERAPHGIVKLPVKLTL